MSDLVQEKDHDTPTRVKIETSYQLEDGKVVIVQWMNHCGDNCSALLAGTDGDQYNFFSTDIDDGVEVAAPNLMSLADCILAANVFLGLIPPYNFDPITSPNQR